MVPAAAVISELLPELPESLISSILQHVPLKQRLSRCALVCKAWAAAAAATAHLDVELTGTQKQDKSILSLQSWINTRAVQLASISISFEAVDSGACYPTLTLPCTRLTLERLAVSALLTLHLDTAPQPIVNTFSSSSCSDSSSDSSSSRARSGGSHGASSSAAPVGLLPSLRELHISCSLMLQHLKQLSQLTALHSLYLAPHELLRTACSSSIKLAAKEDAFAVVSDVLAQLGGLRQLTVALSDSCTLFGVQPQPPALVLQHFGRMQALQGLKLTPARCAFDELLPHLPPSLTALVLSDVTAGQHAGTLLQAAARLTRLRRFELANSDLHPRILRSWPGLQHLSLEDVDVRCSSAATGALAVPAGDAGGAAGGGAAAAAGGPAAAAEAGPTSSDEQEPLQQFLLSIQQISQLQHLALCNVGDASYTKVLDQLPFAALTASTHLTCVQLSVMRGMPLPPFGLRQCFEPGRLLPALRVLQLSGRVSPAPETDRQAGYDTGDLLRVAAGCPGLQELSLQGVTAPSFHCHKLLAALGSDLQTLDMRSCYFGSAAVAALARLCGLQSLALVDCGLPFNGMPRLTALSRLTHLQLNRCFDRFQLQHRPRPAFSDMNLWASPEAEQPDVWQQLADRLRDLTTGA